MVYPEGKPGSIMTQEKVQDLQLINRNNFEVAKEKLGTKYLCHPSNQVKKIVNKNSFKG